MSLDILLSCGAWVCSPALSRSWLLKTRTRASTVNSTNAVGGSFIFSLQKNTPSRFFSHFLSRSGPRGPLGNPPNAVGGLFILSLHQRRPKGSLVFCLPSLA